jgi:hypothetical protein
MVLLTRSASLFSSRAPSLLLASVSRHARTTGLASRGGALNPPKFSPLLTQRLLTTRREKVKVLAVLYDGGKHAEEVRSPPFLIPYFFVSGHWPIGHRPSLACRWPFPIPKTERQTDVFGCRSAMRRAVCGCGVPYRGAHLRHGPGLQGGEGKVSASSEKWGCHRGGQPAWRC